MTFRSRRAVRLFARATAAVGISAATLALAAGASGAAPNATFSFPAAGQTFNCAIAGAPVQFTTTGGLIRGVNQMSQDATGGVHFTGTIALQQVTASDGVTATPYSIVGSSWYGGNGPTISSATVIDTAEFNIIGPQGKVADVHAEATIYPDGTVKGVTIGNCVAPS